MLNRPRPLALIILDGWGDRKPTPDNAIAKANKPFWDMLFKQYPHTLLSASGQSVGLPKGQMGNSEVGHLNMGAGRTVNQDLTKIDLAIQDQSFFSNPVLLDAITKTQDAKKALHIFGLLSPGGIHSHEAHIQALIALAAKKKLTEVYLHIFLDGRDTPPCSALSSIQSLTEYCNQLNCGKIVSMIGRYYAMDRDKRWDRVQKAYELVTSGTADYHADNAAEGLSLAYARQENDEFVKATAIHEPNQPAVTIQDNDTIIFMNFRADRARELCHAFLDRDFNGFHRSYWPKINLVTLTEYDKNFNVPVIFSPESMKNILADYLSALGLRQLRIAETEKYAHITFFFNGGIEKPFQGEERILIPSPKISTYDLQPEMSAYEVTNRLIEEINRNYYDVIICNFANPDMVGHTGNLPAAIKAIETIDACLAKIIPALQAVGGEALITADHGNAEMMFDENTQQPHTAHTKELVPLMYIGRHAHPIHSDGTLSDIAPTMLYLLDIAQPNEMTGRPLFTLAK